MTIKRWKRARVTKALGAAALLGALVVIDVSPVSAAFPGRNGRIFCASSRDGNSEIYSFAADGGDARRLTSDAAADLESTVSPDGTKVAFTSTRSGDQEIYIMNQDGSGVKRLTFSPGEDRPGTFSPDGTKLAFHTGRFPVPPGPGHSTLEIMIMDIDGSNVRRMTRNNFQDSFAHWSPQGDRIAFTTNRDSFVNASNQLVSNFEIYTLVPVDANNDGNADVQTRVTNSPNEDAHASWSPDASQLVFHSRRDATPAAPGIIEIYRASSVDGSNAVRLTNDAIFDAFPSWSPDGQKVLWSRLFPSEAFTANAVDGSGQVNISNHPADDTRCDWSRLLPCTVTGSGTIVGTEGDDVICGSPGDDRIVGMGGNDVIYAGAGNDQIDAGSGDDIVFGEKGHDTISGGDGNDILFGDQGFDRISAGAGDDLASGSEDFDQVSGDDGTDECYSEGLSTCP